MHIVFLLFGSYIKKKKKKEQELKYNHFYSEKTLNKKRKALFRQLN